MKEKLFSKGIIYVIGSILTQLINFLLVPIYTNKLSLEEVGSFNMITTIQSLLAILITLSIYSGMSRFFNEVKDKERLKNTAITFALIWASIVIFFVIIIGDNIINLLIKDTFNSKYLKIIIITVMIEPIINIYSAYYLMKFKAIRCVVINVGSALIKCFISMVLVLFYNKGIMGLLCGQLIGTIICAITILFFNMRSIKIVIDFDYLKKMLRYSVGLIPGLISTWILTLIDRFFLNNMCGLDTVAVYSISYKVGMLVNPFFIIPFANIFNAYKFKVYKEEEGRLKLNNMLKYFSYIGWLVIFVIAIFSKEVIIIISNKNYLSGVYLIPLISISYFIWGLSNFYSFGLHIKNKMLINSSIVAISAIINVCLNIILISKFSMYGATLATIISYIVANILYYYVSKKYYDMEFSLSKPFLLGIYFIILYCIKIISSSIIKYNFFISIILNIFLCFIYILIVYITDKDIRNIIINVLRKINNKYLTVVYGYILENKVCIEEIESLNYKFKEIEEIDLEYMRINYKDEFNSRKYEILKNRLSNDKIKGFIVVENDEICGYFHVSNVPVFDTCINKEVVIPKDSVYFFDDYTFNKFRKKKVHQYSIIKRVNYCNNINKNCCVNIIYGNIASENSYKKLGFNKYIKYKYYKIFKFTKINKLETYN